MKRFIEVLHGKEVKQKVNMMYHCSLGKKPILHAGECCVWRHWREYWKRQFGDGDLYARCEIVYQITESKFVSKI